MKLPKIKPAHIAGYVATVGAGIAGLAYGSSEAIEYVRNLNTIPEVTVPLSALGSTVASTYALTGKHELGKRVFGKGVTIPGVHHLGKKVGQFCGYLNGKLSGTKKALLPTLLPTATAAAIALTPANKGIEDAVGFYNHVRGIADDMSDDYGPSFVPNKTIEDKIENTSKHSVEGRLYRVLRFDPLIQKWAKERGQTPSYDAGLIAQESYGEPLQLNSTGDGGAGLGQFQPGTAREMGLKVYGDSHKTGADHKHGKELVELVKTKTFDELKELDERFNPELAIEKLTGYLQNRQKAFNTDEIGALSAYNRGSPAKDPKATKHIQGVLKYANAYDALREDLAKQENIWNRIWRIGESR